MVAFGAGVALLIPSVMAALRREIDRKKMPADAAAGGERAAAGV